MKYLALMFLIAINMITYMANKKDPSHRTIIGAAAYKEFKQTQGGK